MKKGYLCPQCGNDETATLEVIFSGRALLPLLLVPQKILRDQDVSISCADCGWLADADNFRTGKRRKYPLNVRA